MKKTILSMAKKLPTLNEGYKMQVNRLFPFTKKDQVDPFLLFDYFKGSQPGGVPDHPHRGMQTLSYLLTGRLLHEDFKGNKGILTTGAAQLMTAGKGILHSEAPSCENEETTGYQIWINLPKKEKMVEPCYAEFKAEQVPSAKGDLFEVKVLCGEFQGVKGAIDHPLKVDVLVMHLEVGGQVKYALKKGHNGFMVVSSGELLVNETPLNAIEGVTFELNESEETELSIKAVKKADLQLCAGKPLGEPMARAGPFVMNTKEEIDQCYIDVKNSTNGFESAKGWKSENGKRILRHMSEHKISG